MFHKLKNSGFNVCSICGLLGGDGCFLPGGKLFSFGGFARIGIRFKMPQANVRLNCSLT
jgi:hypothetical protein